MKLLNKFTSKLNFKKIAIAYVICAVAAGILSVAVLGVTFRERLYFAKAYHDVGEKIEGEKTAAQEDLLNQLSIFAQNNSNILDILILDSNNNIIYSAKDSELSQFGTFTLTPKRNFKSRLLSLVENENITFRLKDGEERDMRGMWQDREDEARSEHDDDTFFERNYHEKAMYSLSYIGNEKNGDRVYFIENSIPVPNGMLIVKIIAALAVLFFMFYWVLLALYVYESARKAKLNATIWGIITLFTNLAGLLVFTIYKQNGSLCNSCGSLQIKANIYCNQCGGKLADTCGKCGAIIGTNDKFCPHCGSATGEESANDE